MAPPPIITRTNFPPRLRQYLDQLPPLAIPTPAAIQGLLDRDVPRQWHETPSGVARLRNEHALLERAGLHTTNIFTIAGRSRTLLIRGCIDSKPLAIRGAPMVHSYAYIIGIPATYPYHYPVLHFTSERHVTMHGTQLSPPYEQVTHPYVPPPIHHYMDGHACICEHDSVAQRFGGVGWKDTHTIVTFLGWARIYIASLEVYRENGTWPKDERVHAA